MPKVTIRARAQYSTGKRMHSRICSTSRTENLGWMPYSSQSGLNPTTTCSVASNRERPVSRGIVLAYTDTRYSSISRLIRKSDRDFESYDRKVRFRIWFSARDEPRRWPVGLFRPGDANRIDRADVNTFVAAGAFEAPAGTELVTA